MRRLLLVPVLVALAVRPVAATTADDLCAPTADPCVVSASVAVDDNSTIDVGGRALVITGSGTLDGGGGSMFLVAGRFEMQPGARLLSKAGSIEVDTVDAIDVQATAAKARIDVSGNDGGFVTLLAGGALTVDGQILANALAASGDGGSLDVEGLGVELGADARLSAQGGRTGFGGDITVAASASLLIAGTLDASAGSDGGPICLEAENDLVTTAAAVFSGRSGAGGVGDELDLTSFSGSVTLDGVVNGQAAGSTDLGGGSGMALVIDANGDVTVDAAIDLSGAGSDGAGGSADFGANGDITYRGTIDVSAPGGFGSGGEASFVTDQGLVDLQGDVDATGPASAGFIQAQSFGDVRVSGSLVADGPSGFLGGGVDLEGCGIAVPAGAELSSAKASATGQGTRNTLKASGQMTVAGLLAAGVENRLEYLDPGQPPILAGASITPAATVVNNPMLIPCGGIVTTTTTTSTSTSTTASTSTATSSTETTSTSTSTTSTSTTETTSTTTSITETTTSTTSTTSAPLPTTTTTTTVAPTTTTASTSTTTSTSEASSTSTTVAPTTMTTAPTLATTTTTARASATTSTTILPPAPTCDPVSCDDGDGCTVDSCDAQRGCVHETRTGFDAVSCRLDAISAELHRAPAGDVGGTGAQARLEASVAKVTHLTEAARPLHGRTLVVHLKRAKRLLGSFVRTVRKGQQRGKIRASLAERVLALATDAANRLQPFAQKR